MIYMNILKHIWRSSYQLIIFDKADTKLLNPLFFGSAFALKYGQETFLITANHVVNPGAHGLDNCSKREYSCYVNTNKQEGLTTAMIPVGGIYEFLDIDLMLEYSEEELREAGINMSDCTKPLDLSFAKVDENCLNNCITRTLYDDNNSNILVKEGLKKNILSVQSIDSPNTNDEYIICGVVGNDINDDIHLTGRGVHYRNIKYKEQRSDGLIIFQNNSPIISQNWEALSGSAIFNQKGMVVGMVVEIYEQDNDMVVIPINKIKNLLSLKK